MKNLKVLIACLLFLSCNKVDSPVPVIPEIKPSAALLDLPLNNEVCTTGLIVSATESTISFSWKASDNTESYDLFVKDLESGITSTITVTQPLALKTLKRNTPYSWYVTSKNTKSNSTAKSQTWKFYNQGEGTKSYAPFPAEIVAPTMGESITSTAGKVRLVWNGSDPDNDIVDYDIYFGISSSPLLLKSGVKESQLQDVTIIQGTTYYWQVISKDSKGNTSESGIFQFKVK